MGALHLDDFPLAPFTGLCPLRLNPPGQFLLPPQLNDRVLFGDLGVRVPGNLRSLNAAAADFLPPCDVRATKGMRTEAGEVAALRGRGSLQRLTHTRVPHRHDLILILWEDPGLRTTALQVADPRL